VTSLSLYDVAPITPGVACDLSHIPTNVKVEGFSGPENIGAALKDADVVVVPAGVPRKPGMTRDDLFNVNANINYSVASECAKQCPNASYLIISNPVNSTVPIWAETLKKFGVYNPKKLFGVTTLDQFRANTFASEKAGKSVTVPVVGGHAGTTIVPLFSLASAPVPVEGEELDNLTTRVMFGGDEVVKAKAGGGSATLSMAAAGAKFTEAVLAGYAGKTVTKELAFVESPEYNEAFGTAFFATEVDLGKDGITKIHTTALNANDYEKKKIAEMLNDLKAQIKKGVDFVASK